MPKTKSSTLNRSRKLFKPRNSILSKSIDESSEQAFLYAQNRDQSPLLRLPAELRWMIYEYALGGKSIYVKHTAPQWRKRQDNGTEEWVYTRHSGFHSTVFEGQVNPFTAPAWGPTAPIGQGGLALLSGVCRQLYQETATLPFEFNVLAFQSHYVLNRYVWKERRLPLFQRRAVKTLFVPEYRPSATIEKYLGGLDTVRVDTTKFVIEHDQKNGKTSKIRKSEEEVQYAKRMKLYV